MTISPSRLAKKPTLPAQPKTLPSRPLRLWQDESSQKEVRIEILPLIDVIFCILTFFILAAVGLSRQQAISLNLPKASNATPQMREMMVVSLDDLGQVYVEKQMVTRNQLNDAVKNYVQLNPSGSIVLHASRNVTYNEVVEVLDLLKGIGGNRVALATRTGEKNSNDSSSLTPAPNQQNFSNPYNNNPVTSPYPYLPANPFNNSQPNPNLKQQPTINP
ncbi:MAG: biopolymer transporter ExbD [Cyanobacteria bacterium J083]|nr:MAG: biopolymer transporter ExbD [Cyanobacteria bacterium J083]